jgi:hypothetical protein
MMSGMCALILLILSDVSGRSRVSLGRFGCTIRMYGYVTCEIAVLPGSSSAVWPTTKALLPLRPHLVYPTCEARPEATQSDRATADRSAAGENAGASTGATLSALSRNHQTSPHASPGEAGGRADDPGRPGRRSGPFDRRAVVEAQGQTMGVVQHGAEAGDIEHRLVPQAAPASRA